MRITFAPTGPGPVVATVSIPTSAGVRTVSVSGYGTQPGLLVSAQPLAFGTVATGAGGKSLTVTVSNFVGPTGTPHRLRASVRALLGERAPTGRDESCPPNRP